MVPSITELLCGLGLGGQLVARTGFCIHPRETLKAVPKVGGTKDVDIAALRALAPSHVIVNVDENRREVVDEIAGFVEHVFVTHPQTPRDNIALYNALGALFQRQSEAAALVAAFERGLEQLGPVSAYEARRVLYLIWKDPWMAVARDTYISNTLALINWTSLPLAPVPPYPEVTLENFAGKVDKVLLSSEPYRFRARHLDEVKAIFGETPDVRLVDGERLSWYGSRAIAGLDYLRELAGQ